LSPSPDGPGFAEPWQARAFALALRLTENGHFTRQEWTMALSRVIGSVADADGHDDGSHYYDHWVAALEALVIDKGLTTRTSLDARTEDWRGAYLRTPHGKPVELASNPE
jgi:nitrile hydratase accessory protein